MNIKSTYDIKQPDHQQWLNHKQMKIAKWLKKLRFRKKFFGGVSEQDVWKKIDELNAMYEDALSAERIRYDTLIEHYKKECAKTTGSRHLTAAEDMNAMIGSSDEQQYNESYIEQREVGNE